MAKVVQIANEANPQSRIQNRQYRDAIIVGPAVLIPLRDVAIRNCTFDGPQDAIFIELRHDQVVVGFIGLVDVSFDGCEFRNVSLAGTPESIANLRAGFG